MSRWTPQHVSVGVRPVPQHVSVGARPCAAPQVTVNGRTVRVGYWTVDGRWVEGDVPAGYAPQPQGKNSVFLWAIPAGLMLIGGLLLGAAVFKNPLTVIV